MAQKVTILLMWYVKRSQWTRGVHTLVWSVLSSFFSSLCLSYINSHWIVERSVSVLAFRSFRSPCQASGGVLRWSVPRLCLHPLGSFPTFKFCGAGIFEDNCQHGQASRFRNSVIKKIPVSARKLRNTQINTCTHTGAAMAQGDSWLKELPVARAATIWALQ